jgi:signal transduction histidine kinase
MPAADIAAIQNFLRLESLKNLNLLDAPVSAAFDRLTRLATHIFHTPVSLVSLVDAQRQFFLSQVGLPEPWASQRETPLSHSFCQHTVATEQPLVIEDARVHPLVFDNLAIQDLNVIAYAGVPLRASDGQIIGSFCVIDSSPRHWTADEIDILVDLTASVISEIELRQQLNEREQMVLERERSRLLADFVRDTSHELRTPLTIIGTSAYLSERTSDPELRRAKLHTISDQVAHLGRILDELSTMAQIEQTVTLRRSRVDIGRLLDELQRRYKDRASSAAITLTLNVQDNLPPVYVDQQMLTQAVHNLLENAILYTPSGGTVSLSARQSDDQLQIEIADTGIGISQDDLPHVFEHFYKANEARTYNGSGAGLGLPMAKRLIQNHRGDIQVSSEIGCGTRFVISLPVERSPERP